MMMREHEMPITLCLTFNYSINVYKIAEDRWPDKKFTGKISHVFVSKAC